MQTIIFSFLAIVIVIGGLWYHDVRYPPEEQARDTQRNQRAMLDGTADQSKEQLVRSLDQALPTPPDAGTIHEGASGERLIGSHPAKRGRLAARGPAGRREADPTDQPRPDLWRAEVRVLWHRLTEPPPGLAFPT